MHRRISGMALMVMALATVTATPVTAAPILVNGGFEAGFAGWTRIDAVGSDGTFFLQTGTSSPVNGFAVPPPPGGSTAAMTDAMGPGAHVLFQDFVVPATVLAATLSFDLFVQNAAGDFFTPATLAFDTPALNQQARVDIILPSADPFSVAAGDVLLNVFQTNPGDPAVSGYDTHTADVTALLTAFVGSTLRLRFAETDNVFFFNLGVDNVALDVRATPTVPEPSAYLLLSLGLSGICAARRRSRSRRHIPY